MALPRSSKPASQSGHHWQGLTSGGALGDPGTALHSRERVWDSSLPPGGERGLGTAPAPGRGLHMSSPPTTELGRPVPVGGARSSGRGTMGTETAFQGSFVPSAPQRGVRLPRAFIFLRVWAPHPPIHTHTLKPWCWHVDPTFTPDSPGFSPFPGFTAAMPGSGWASVSLLPLQDTLLP